MELIGVENVHQLKTEKEAGLKVCFSKLFSADQRDLDRCIQSLDRKFNNPLRDDEIIPTLFLTLNKDFPNDVGVLTLFFLNILQLQPGQAIYLPANEPHAYLDGDCIECMACSDNVIRAGLTPKFKDVDTLLAMLNYGAESGEQKIFLPKICPYLKYTKQFIPPVEDFAVVQIQVPRSQQPTNDCRLENRAHGSILIVITGEAVLKTNTPIALTPGSIVFIPANADNFIPLEILKSSSDFLAYQAMYNNF